MCTIFIFYIYIFQYEIFVSYFLADLFETRLDYHALKSYRSAISDFHYNADSVSTGRHPFITVVTKGIYNSCPPSPQYNLILLHKKWGFPLKISSVENFIFLYSFLDIEVLKHLINYPESHELRLELWSLKFPMILVLIATTGEPEIKSLESWT